MILRLAISVEHPIVTDRQTDTRRQLLPALARVARVKLLYVQKHTRDFSAILVLLRKGKGYYRAKLYMLARYMPWPLFVCPSVCPSQACVLSRHLNASSGTQCCIVARGLFFEIPTVHPTMRVRGAMIISLGHSTR